MKGSPATCPDTGDPAIHPGRRPAPTRLPVVMLPQPDETTCGATCLHALYRFWGVETSLPDIILRMHRMPQGGTFAVFLAVDALRHGFRATLYTYNLLVFDPSWFRGLRAPGLAERLVRQGEVKSDPRLHHVTPGYLEFLGGGGKLKFRDLTPTLLRRLLRRGLPIITGLSATYLYRHPREYGPDDRPDDIRGVPAGHFVVIAGYDPVRDRVLVQDPYEPHPFGETHEYWIDTARAIGAILLGVLTHDANLLVVHPRPEDSP
jgi:hypothetical protein